MSFKYFSLFIGLIFLSSCEKQVTLHPENSAPKIAVEAIFSDFPLVSSVRLSKSKSINETVTFHEQILDATVHIIDLTTNDTIPFTYNAQVEKYQGAVAGIPGHRYKLDILAQEKHLTATKTMTSKVNLDRVISVPTDEDPNLYYLKMQFNDPPQHEDYYLILMQPTDPSSTEEMRFSVMSDRTYNSNDKTITITDEFFNKNEDWMILFFHIDRQNFNYFKVIHRARKSLVNGVHLFYGLSLGNPINTIDSPQALGFFFAAPVTASPIRIGN